jgi:hypothetical protein
LRATAITAAAQQSTVPLVLIVPEPKERWFLNVDYPDRANARRRAVAVSAALGLGAERDGPTQTSLRRLADALGLSRPRIGQERLGWCLGGESPALLDSVERLSALSDELRPIRVGQERRRGDGHEAVVLERLSSTLPAPSELLVRELNTLALPRVTRMQVLCRAGYDTELRLPASAAEAAIGISVEFQDGPRPSLYCGEPLIEGQTFALRAACLTVRWEQTREPGGAASFNLLLAPGPHEQWDRLREGVLAPAHTRARPLTGIAA